MPDDGVTMQVKVQVCLAEAGHDQEPASGRNALPWQRLRLRVPL